MNNFWDSTTGKVIRWITFLPVSIAVAWTAGELIYLLCHIRGDADEGILWPDVTKAAARSGIFFYLMGLIVPQFKKVILFIFVIVFVLLDIFLIVPHLYNNLSWPVMWIIILELSTIAASAAAIYAILKDEI
jgi:hypothetical protein